MISSVIVTSSLRFWLPTIFSTSLRQCQYSLQGPTCLSLQRQTIIDYFEEDVSSKYLHRMSLSAD